ncbi:MAG: diphthamide biosynthesis enzyme Dph2 [Candidatus Bathyarchaeia archaeon]
MDKNIERSFSQFNFEIDRLAGEVKRRGVRRLLIQMPDGLKPYAVNISRELMERTGAEVYISAGSCYGGCDVATGQAKMLNVDLIAHYGHTEFVRVDDCPLIFLEARSELSLTEILNSSESKISIYRRVGVATTVQHLNELAKVEERLQRLGVEAVITPRCGRNRYRGQIIGCDYTPLKMVVDKVESFMVIGSRFHGLGASLAVDKPVILADPYLSKVTEMEEERRSLINRRYAMIERAKGAKSFGIILGSKIGQYNHGTADMLRRVIVARGRGAVTIVADEVTPSSLENFEGVDVFVNTACPRLSIDDSERFAKPFLLPKEALVSIGEMEWEELLDQGLI